MRPGVERGGENDAPAGRELNRCFIDKRLEPGFVLV